MGGRWGFCKATSSGESNGRDLHLLEKSDCLFVVLGSGLSLDCIPQKNSGIQTPEDSGGVTCLAFDPGQNLRRKSAVIHAI